MTFFAAVVNERAEHTFKTLLLKKFDGVTTVGLLLTLVLIFAFQGNTILEKPLHIVCSTAGFADIFSVCDCVSCMQDIEAAT